MSNRRDAGDSGSRVSEVYCERRRRVVSIDALRPASFSSLPRFFLSAGTPPVVDRPHCRPPQNTGHYPTVFAIPTDTSRATISPLPLLIARIYTILDKFHYFQNPADHRLHAKLRKIASTVIRLWRALRKDSCLSYIGNGPSTDSQQNCEFVEYKATNGAGVLAERVTCFLALVVAMLATYFHARLSPIILQIFNAFDPSRDKGIQVQSSLKIRHTDFTGDGQRRGRLSLSRKLGRCAKSHNRGQNSARPAEILSFEEVQNNRTDGHDLEQNASPAEETPRLVELDHRAFSAEGEAKLQETNTTHHRRINPILNLFMADPVSIAGTAAGLISLGIQVTQELVNFYTAYKSQDSALAGMVKRLEDLSSIFQTLESTLSGRNAQKEEEGVIERIGIFIGECDELIHELDEECRKFQRTSSNGIAAAVRVAGRRATYPFRRTTLQALDDTIGEIRNNLWFALDVLQLNDNSRTQDSIAEVKLLLELVRARQISSDLCDWLKAPDATVNHNAACAKKHPGTGMWLIKSPTFSKWLTEQNSILWLNGFAGSGKSVLCSTAIQSALRHRASNSRIGIAFFYFTFNDDSKRDESGMLRALLLQLSGQLQGGEADLTRLHHSYKTGMPPSLELIEYLRRLIQRFGHVYIALDGLDECPSDGSREFVLDTLNAMRGWCIQGLHLFITSRDEPDIRNSLDLHKKQQIQMRNSGIDKDIADSISARLDTDWKLQQWVPHRDKIQETLTKRAKVVSLQFCPRSEDHLDRFLNSLPQSLDETYERMLCNINHLLVEDARRILTLLCFAARPLTVKELIEGVAVKIEDPPGLNCKLRLHGFDDLSKICPGFIEIDSGTAHPTETYYGEKALTSTVQIAHFSIQEYLESERIRHKNAKIFSLDSFTAHAEIAQICLVYLLEHVFSNSELDRNVLQEYPLARFAAEHWNRHYQNAIKPASKLDELILRLFQRQDTFLNWVRLYDLDLPAPYLAALGSKLNFNIRSAASIAAPVYYASLLGLDRVLNEIVRTAQVEDMITPSLTSKISGLVNAQGGWYSNALQAASLGGHKKIIRLLLDNGADVNTAGGTYGNALQAASYGGHQQIAHLLLERGADVDAQGGKYGNALQAASEKGHEQIVQLLLDRGADVNAPGGYYGNALQGASLGGHEQIVSLLLERGADVKAPGGEYGNALQEASYKGHEQIVQLLLDRGADVNAQGGLYGNALQGASEKGHEQIVQLLLDRGADVNAPGGYYGNALQGASLGGHEQIVSLLLERGADVKAPGGEYGNALQGASYKGHEQIVQLLLDRGADVNAQGGLYGNALHGASYTGHEQIVQLLLGRGADVNAQGGFYGNALQAASYGGHQQILRLLLERGVDVDAQGGEYGNALQGASYGGHQQIVSLLLERGADVNAPGGIYGSALQKASYKGHEQIVQLLLDRGADVNAPGGMYGNALQAASWGGHKEVIKLLLAKGAIEEKPEEQAE
ncbi:hypothetical protein MMC29_007485 [Sticta canariensis]|nr:hypothetical protein [Sticta canariensis]